MTVACVVWLILTIGSSAMDITSIKLVGKLPLQDTWTAVGDLDLRHNTERIHHLHYGLGASHPLWSQWTGTIAYRHVHQYRNNQWTTEHRPYLQAKQTIAMSWITWTLRHRFEYRIRDDHTTRYRFQLAVRAPMGNFTPFIRNEWFHRFHDGTIHKNWLSIGTKCPRTAWGTPSLYYTYVTTQKNNDWIPAHTMVLKWAL